MWKFALKAGILPFKLGAKLLRSKPTVGTLMAGAVALPGFAWVDNKLGNKPSKFALEHTPVGYLVEKGLALKGWADGQTAEVLQHHVEDALVKRGKIDLETYKGSDREILLSAACKGATGGSFAVASELAKLKDIDITDADIAASIRKAQKFDGTIDEKSAVFFESISETIEERREKTLDEKAKLSKKAEQDDHTRLVTQEENANTPGLKEPFASLAALGAAQKSALRNVKLGSLTDESLSSVFEKATEKMGGFSGLVFKTMAGLAGKFSESAERWIQTLAISSLDAKNKFDVLKDAASEGLLVSANNNPFNIPMGGLRPSYDLG